jgi:hypothetical protein
MEVAFDFGSIAEQGLWLTKVTLGSLEEWLGEAVVPGHSQYHLVGCAWGLIPILSKMNVWVILEKYIALRRYLPLSLAKPWWTSAFRLRNSSLRRFTWDGISSSEAGCSASGSAHRPEAAAVPGLGIARVQ